MKICSPASLFYVSLGGPESHRYFVGALVCSIMLKLIYSTYSKNFVHTYIPKPPNYPPLYSAEHWKWSLRICPSLSRPQLMGGLSKGPKLLGNISRLPLLSDPATWFQWAGLISLGGLSCLLTSCTYRLLYLCLFCARWCFTWCNNPFIGGMIYGSNKDARK